MKKNLASDWPNIIIVADGSCGESSAILGISPEYIVESCNAYGANAVIERPDQRQVIINRWLVTTMSSFFSPWPIPWPKASLGGCHMVHFWKESIQICGSTLAPSLLEIARPGRTCILVAPIPAPMLSLTILLLLPSHHPNRPLPNDGTGEARLAAAMQPEPFIICNDVTKEYVIAHHIISVLQTLLQFWHMSSSSTVGRYNWAINILIHTRQLK